MIPRHRKIRREEIVAAVDLHGARPVLVPDWQEGIAASLRAGVAAASGADAVMIALGDQAWLTPGAVAAVAQAWDGSSPAVRAIHDGALGHPVLIARDHFDAVSQLRGDEGARSLLARTRRQSADGSLLTDLRRSANRSNHGGRRGGARAHAAAGVA